MSKIMRIRALRQQAGLTQTQLGAGMGVAQNCISDWENEVALPRARQLPELARLLDCTIDELYEPEALTSSI